MRVRQGAGGVLLQGRRQTGALSASTSSSLPISSCFFSRPSTAPTAFLCSAGARRAQGAVGSAWGGPSSAQLRPRSCRGWPWLREALRSWWAWRQICVSRRAERRDEEDVSIDTSHTHSLSSSIIPISSTSPSLHLALHALVLVVAHLQLHRHLQRHPACLECLRSCAHGQNSTVSHCTY